MEYSYPQVVSGLVDLLGLTRDALGLARLWDALLVAKILEIRIEEGEFEGCLDARCIDDEILPKILEEHPELREFLEQAREKGADIALLASWIRVFTEDLHLISGDRPLPLQDIVPVKNIGEKYKFGFLAWNSPGCTVTVTRDPELEDGHDPYKLEYKTMWDALEANWKVD